jgi:ketosteroid isomerase-like protein
MNGRRVYPTLFLLVNLAVAAGSGVYAQQRRAPSTAPRAEAVAESRLTGVYRLNAELSDRLYSVVSSASSNLPFGEQQRFFIDLTERITPPDQLAIRRRGSLVEIASSRAPRTTFTADGRERVERAARATYRERAVVAGESLTLTSESSRGEGYRVTFTPIEGGARLRVTRRIIFKELNQPVVLNSVYDRISDVARWEIYGEPQRGLTAGKSVVAPVVGGPPDRLGEAAEADALRAELGGWVEATNEKDIGRQMDFYMPRLRAYYLTRDTPRGTVRAEKARVFSGASAVSISAEEPEIVFLEGGLAAVMRFRKRYQIEGGPRSGRGEVIQELRWRKTDGGWKIYSERDIRVIR